MPLSTASCPRCREPLHVVDLSGVSVHACPKCHGTRLGRAELPRVLEAMSAELLETFDPDTKLEPAGARDERLACATCGAEMSRDDYCGAGLAHFDRCEACAVLWVDADALGTMTLMWARMETRHSRDERETRRLLEEADDLVVRTLIARAVSRRLFRVFG
jgi:Zn-finger nucleic acid-binding protein